MVSFCLAMILLMDQSPGSAQGPSTPKQELDATARASMVSEGKPSDSTQRPQAEIVFDEKRIENVREGYQTIRWVMLERAARYDVVDARDRLFYSGEQNEAFISGLPDGEHAFNVRAYREDGTLIGASRTPVVIVVQHWPMGQAWALLAMGTVVFVVMIGLIVFGAAQTGAKERGA